MCTNFKLKEEVEVISIENASTLNSELIIESKYYSSKTAKEMTY